MKQQDQFNALSVVEKSTSFAKNIGEVYEVISLIEKFRGKVEGGVCVREFEVLQPETEKRYFVFNKIAFARNGVVPTIVNEIAKKIDCPFFSVDMVLSIDDAPRLVELGDGQVSDRKKWAVDRFFDVFKHHA